MCSVHFGESGCTAEESYNVFISGVFASCVVGKFTSMSGFELIFPHLLLFVQSVFLKMFH